MFLSGQVCIHPMRNGFGALTLDLLEAPFTAPTIVQQLHLE